VSVREQSLKIVEKESTKREQNESTEQTETKSYLGTRGQDFVDLLFRDVHFTLANLLHLQQTKKLILKELKIGKNGVAENSNVGAPAWCR